MKQLSLSSPRPPRWSRPCALVVTLVTVATLLSACEEIEIRDPGAFAIVSGYRNNTPPPRIKGKARDWLAEAALAGDKLFIIGVDGFPEELLATTFDPDCDGVKAACESFQRDQVDYIDGKLRLPGAQADDPEADVLEAIVIAARRMSEIDGPKHIVVIDSGLQTTGVMPMGSPGAFRADPKRVAAPLLDDERFQLLRGVKVLFSGLGSYADPQTRLSDADVAALEGLWRGVLTELGATVEVDHVPLDGPEELPANLPFVSIVAEQAPPPPSQCVVLREDEIGFLPDLAELRNPAQAREVLEPVAAQLTATNVVATLIGTTALDDGPDHRLSADRAETVKRILVELGVPERNLVTVGVGTNFTKYDNPYVNGVFSEIIAMRNRLVIIQPAGQSC